MWLKSSFLADMSQAERLEQIVAEFFVGARVPPHVVTEWRQESAHVEIELMAVSSVRLAANESSMLSRSLAVSAASRASMVVAPS